MRAPLRKVTDTFTDTNTTAITSHTANVGGGWTGAGGSIVIQSNRATDGNSSAFNAANLTNDLVEPDCDLRAVVNMNGSNADAYYLGVSARATTAAGTDGYKFYWEESSSWWIIAQDIYSQTETNDGLGVGVDQAIAMKLRNDWRVGYVLGTSTSVRIPAGFGADPAQNFAGIVVGNFVGGAVGNGQVDSFEVDIIRTTPQVAAQSIVRLSNW